jgi:hypothetical protein
MDDKFIEILHKNVNKSIDSLNEFRKEYDGNTFDSTISYLIHEIEHLKLLKEKRAVNYNTDGRILNSDIYEVYDILDNKIFEGTIKQISKKYDLENGSIRTAYKRCSMLNKKFKFIKK